MDGLTEYAVVHPPTSSEFIGLVHDSTEFGRKDRKTTVRILGLYAVPRPEIIDCEFEIKRISYNEDDTQHIIGTKSSGGLIHIRTASNPEDPAVASMVG